MAKYSNMDIDRVLTVLKALADRQRLRVLCAIGNRKLCVCQVVEVLGLAPSTVSKHLLVLRQAGLVERAKEGRWVFYRRACSVQMPGAKRIVECLKRALMGDTMIRADAERLARVLEIDPEVLCRKQMRRR